jgi:hypothetical protein
MPTDVEIKWELDLREASEELLEWAKENIREDPNTKCQMISDLRDMIYCKLSSLIVDKKIAWK